jgi:hypothetical protein
MKTFSLVQVLIAVALIVLLLVTSSSYLATDTRGQGVITRKFVIERGEIDQYFIETADGRVFTLMLGKIQFDDLRVGDFARWRARGYPIQWGNTLLIPPAIYYVVPVR